MNTLINLYGRVFPTGYRLSRSTQMHSDVLVEEREKYRCEHYDPRLLPVLLYEFEVDLYWAMGCPVTYVWVTDSSGMDRIEAILV